MRRLARLAAPALIVGCIACTGRGGRALEPPPPYPADYDVRPENSLTFSEHVAPIVFADCAPCHRPGEAAPFSLLDYEQVRKRAGQIAHVTNEGYMPPWLPEPGYGDFVGERRLTTDEIGILNQWAREGAPPGDPELAPPVPEFTEGWRLGEPDRIVTMPEAYTVKAGDGDLFRNFVFPVELDETIHVRSIEFRPDNLRVMHHATIAVDPTPRSRYHDDLDPEAGFDGMINTNAQRPDGHLVGWVPGKLPFEGREDIAWRLEPGADLVVQFHLQPTGREETVRPVIGLFFSDRPPTRTPFLLRLGSLLMDIPAGEDDYEIRDTYVLPIDVEVLGLVPHAHYIGNLMESWADLPDGRREWLLRIDDWDFNWQDEYRYREPVSLPKGSALTMRFTFDNSDRNERNPNRPARRVRYGPNTSDEMGDLWVQVLPVHENELEILRRDFGARDLDAQIAGCRQYLTHDPDDYATRHVLAEMLATRGEPDEAIELYRQVLEARPDYALAHSNLGGILLARGELDPAIGHYREAIRVEPDMHELHFNLGQILKQQGKTDEAIAAFERALELQPGLGRIHFVLGNLYMTRRQLERAIEHFRQAVRLDDGNPEAHNNYGTLLGMQGRLEPAIVEFRRALELRPDHAKSHFNLGTALARSGRLDAAIEQFRATLALEPDHARARRSLDMALGHRRK